MDFVSILRTLGGLGTVLGILSGALWLVRRYDIRLPGRTGMLRVSRLELVERLPLDARRSVALLRRDGREHLILIAPEGHLILESGVIRDAIDVVAEDALADALPREIPQFRAELAAAGESFGTLVDHARDRAVPFGRALANLLGRAVAFVASARARVDDLLRTRSGVVKTLLATVKRTRAPAQAGAERINAVVRKARLLLAQEHRHVSTQVKTMLRRLMAPDSALAVSASPIFPDPPIPPRSSLQRQPNRKAVRRAQAARKGSRHA